MPLLHSKEIIVIPLKLPPVAESAAGAGWSWRRRGAAALVALLLYAYVLLFVKTLYLKEQRLERISNAMVKTVEMTEHLYARDEKLSANIQHLLSHSNR